MSKDNDEYSDEMTKTNSIMNKILFSTGALLLLVFQSFSQFNYSQEKTNPSPTVPFYDLFYHLDQHFLGSFTMSDGIYPIISVPITYALIKTGADWNWNNFAYNHGLSKNFAAAEAGTILPVLIPASLYLYGWTTGNRNLQVTGLAIGQAALLSVAVSSFLKAITGRRPPNDRDVPRKEGDYSGDFHFGFLRRGAYDGWPSSHTMVSVSMASALNALYPDNLALSIVSYTIAAFIGVGVSTNIHWLSDVVAGGLIGYAIGRSVGCGFRGLINQDSNGSSLNFSILPNGVGISYVF
jgi:membrane-associated phospholipid phosphatase